MEFIEFPHLGIRLNISPIAFEIGPFTVHWYGIIIATAIMAALLLAMKETKKFGFDEDSFLDMFLIALPVSIVFARLFFVVFLWDAYKDNILDIFKIWEGGLAIYGAIIGTVISVFIYTRVKKINMWDVLDFACVYLPLAQAIGRWGNFTNQELYGKNTDLPWGMTGSIIMRNPYPGVDPSKLVHPTFLYESLLNVFVFLILYRVRKNRKVRGSVFAVYLMLYSLVRFVTEFLRADEFGIGNIRYNQVFAVIVFIVAFAWLLLLKKRSSDIAGDEPLEPSSYSEVLHILDDEENHEREEEVHDEEVHQEEVHHEEAREEEVHQEEVHQEEVLDEEAEETINENETTDAEELSDDDPPLN